jgi:ferritin-like metal-binding protein YciE
LLQQNLDEEKAVDKKLTAMAESKVTAAPRRPPACRYGGTGL